MEGKHMKLCKDCIYYRKGGNGSHWCAASVSMVTGEVELRDAVSMRNGVYILGACGRDATLFQPLIKTKEPT
jgi:hypothetical protein